MQLLNVLSQLVNRLLELAQGGHDPPFIGADVGCRCKTVAGPFDVVGHFFYGRISAKF